MGLFIYAFFLQFSFIMTSRRLLSDEQLVRLLLHKENASISKESSGSETEDNVEVDGVKTDIQLEESSDPLHDNDIQERVSLALMHVSYKHLLF